MTKTHAAGNAVKIKEREIQRCAVCGVKLVDNVPGKREDGVKPKLPIWPLGALVRIDADGRQTPVGDVIDDERLPADFCLTSL